MGERFHGNQINQWAEGRLLQLNIGNSQLSVVILIELVWNSQAQSSYEIEWVESVRRKPKFNGTRMQNTASCMDIMKNYGENTKRVS